MPKRRRKQELLPKRSTGQASPRRPKRKATRHIATHDPQNRRQKWQHTWKSGEQVRTRLRTSFLHKNGEPSRAKTRSLFIIRGSTESIWIRPSRIRSSKTSRPMLRPRSMPRGKSLRLSLSRSGQHLAKPTLLEPGDSDKSRHSNWLRKQNQIRTVCKHLKS